MLLTDDCTLERFAGGVPAPAARAPHNGPSQAAAAPALAFPRAGLRRSHPEAPSPHGRGAPGSEPPASRASAAGAGSCSASLGCTPAPRRPLCAEQMP